MPSKRRTSTARFTENGRVPAGTPTPRVSVSASSFTSNRTDVAVCFAYDTGDKPLLPGITAKGRVAKVLSRLARTEKFKGNSKEIISWNSGGQLPAAHYLLVGLGKRSASTLDALREAMALAARRATGLPAKKMTVLPPKQDSADKTADAVEAVTEGIALGSYRMSKYLTGDNAHKMTLRSAEILVDRGSLRAARAGLAEGTVRARATNFTRDIVNEPAIVLTPARMAEVARGVAKECGLEIKVLEKKDLMKMGMGALLGVSAGSAELPCLIHVTYRPKGIRKPRKVAFVGKGITFDSGGLSLKTSIGMETMKLDKAGACAVLGAMSALPALKPPVEVHGIMAMTENMPSGTAIKPGDVLRTMSGKTIEVLNTDAEGRLILADALGYAQTLKVERIIDLATLTGACMVALGPASTGVFGNDQEMIDMLDRKDGWLAQLAKEKPADDRVDELVTSAYLRTLSRRPIEVELADCREHIAASENIMEGLRDLMWALLNTQEFIANH